MIGLRPRLLNSIGDTRGSCMPHSTTIKEKVRKVEEVTNRVATNETALGKAGD